MLFCLHFEFAFALLNVLDLAYRRPFVGWSFEVWVINFCCSNVCSLTENPNALLANRKIRCIYAVLANKIICIYLCSCVFMSRFGRDLNPIRDGWQCWLSTQATYQMRLLVWRVVNKTLKFFLTFLMLTINSRSPWEMISGFNLTVTRRDKGWNSVAVFVRSVWLHSFLLSWPRGHLRVSRFARRTKKKERLLVV